MQFHIKIKSKILARMDMEITEALNYGQTKNSHMHYNKA